MPEQLKESLGQYRLTEDSASMVIRWLSILPQSVIWWRIHLGTTVLMKMSLSRLLCAILCCLVVLGAGGALAHPHVWVTVKSEIVYAADGTVTGIRHAWTFDDMFSTFATQGLESKVKGQFTREELAPLAEVNISSLKEFDYFTRAQADGKKALFNDPADYWLDYGNSVLTLHFTLPFKSPVKARNLELGIFDPTMFVDFVLAEKEPVALAGAPARCQVAVARATSVAARGLNESFFNSLGQSSNFGAQFANKVAVSCP
jgi:ABC-type uncharacterized transport system substrate-binding protein